MSRSSHNRLKATAYLLLNTLCWGASFVIVAPAFTHTTPFQFLFYRFALASILMSPVLWLYLRQRKYRQHIWPIIGIELLGTVVYLSLLYEGLSRSTSIETSLLATTTPLFIILASVLFIHEKQTKKEWLGLGISVLGVLFIASLPLLNGAVGLHGVSLGGNALILLANTVGALYAILIKTRYKNVPHFLAPTVSFFLGAVVFGFLSLLQLQFSLPALTSAIQLDWQQPTVVFASLYMAIFGSIIGLTAYIKGQELIEASEASLFYYLQPLVYLPLGVIVLNEAISPYQIIGLIFILIGVGVSESR